MSSNGPTTMLDGAPSLQMPGQRLIDAGEVYALFNSLFGTQTVQATGNNRNLGTQITAAINLVLNANATNFYLILPPGTIGRQITIINNTSVGISVAPFGTQDFIIPAGATNPTLAASQAAASTAIYICILQTTPPTGPSPITYWKQVGVTGM